MTTEEQVQTRQWIARFESELESLRRDLEPVNPARFQLMAEGYIDIIRQLRAQLADDSPASGAAAGVSAPPVFDAGKSPAN